MKMKKHLLSMLGIMAVGAYAASVEFGYTLMVDGQSADEAIYQFGRINGAQDILDAHDEPMPPGLPIDDGSLSYMYFLGQAGLDSNNGAANAMDVLRADFRDPATDATTWTIAVGNADVPISWTGSYTGADGKSVNKPLASGNGILAIYKEGSDNAVVADMRSTTSLVLNANSVYSIRYQAAKSAVVAPDTPAEIQKSMAIYTNAVSTTKILDPEKYDLVSLKGAYYKGEEAVTVSTDGSEFAYDSESGILSYTYPDGLDPESFDSMKVLYTFKYKNNETRAESGNPGIGAGLVRAVVINYPYLELASDDVMTINMKNADKSCTVEYSFLIPQLYAATLTENVKLAAKIALPTWKYKTGKCEALPWTVSVTVDGAAVKGYSIASDPAKPANGDAVNTTLTFTKDAPLVSTKTEGSHTIAIKLVAADGAKTGMLSLTGSYEEASGTIELPLDGFNTSAKVKVTGVGNLNVDESEYFDVDDELLIYKYLYGGDEDDDILLHGTPYGKLTGKEKAAKAALIRGNIEDMGEDMLNLDESEYFDVDDDLYIYNYLYGGDTDDDKLLRGTPFGKLTGDAKAKKAAQIRANIEDMIED